jgi:hypothetical protein
MRAFLMTPESVALQRHRVEQIAKDNKIVAIVIDEAHW